MELAVILTRFTVGQIVNASTPAALNTAGAVEDAKTQLQTALQSSKIVALLDGYGTPLPISPRWQVNLNTDGEYALSTFIDRSAPLRTVRFALLPRLAAGSYCVVEDRRATPPLRAVLTPSTPDYPCTLQP